MRRRFKRAAPISDDVYPGIDVIYKGHQNQLEYDFVIAPGADIDAIRIGFTGVDNLRLANNGDLVMETAAGVLRHRKPVIYQAINHRRVAISGGYALHSNNQVGFRVAAYDKSKPLIVDPVLEYATYFGSGEADKGLGIAVDNTGHAYIIGTTFSVKDDGKHKQSGKHKRDADVFIAKLSQDGSSLIYSTHLGGRGDEGNPTQHDDENYYGKGLAVDAKGQVIVTGSTTSHDDFPLVNALQTRYGGGKRDAFVTKLSAAGQDLIYSTYLGGKDTERGLAVTLDATGNAYVAGGTESKDFPIAHAFQPKRVGKRDAFVAKLPPDGSDLIYSTFLGGKKDDIAKAIAVDTQGRAVITGFTRSKKEFPTENPVQPRFGGGPRDAFIARLTSQGDQLDYATFIGGSKSDTGEGIAVDKTGRIVVAGHTQSGNDFPIVNAMQSLFGGERDGFILRLKDDEATIDYSTYLGGNASDSIKALAVDKTSNVYATGVTRSDNFPIVDEIRGTRAGQSDAFVSKLSATGTELLYSTYLGGNHRDIGRAIVVDNTGAAYITGVTRSDSEFPLQIPLEPFFLGGGRDAFIVKVKGGSVPPTLAFSEPAPESFSNTAMPTFTLTYNDVDDDLLPDTLRFELAGQALPVNCVTEITSANCTPIEPLPEGPVTLTTTIADAADNISEPATLTLTIDTVPPEVTITSPRNGGYTNNASKVLTGSVNETLTAFSVNATPVPLDDQNAFSYPLALTEGLNTYQITATDAAGNQTDLTGTVYLDTVIPTAPDIGRVSFTALSDDGRITLVGSPNSVESRAWVVITHPETGEIVTVLADDQGGFIAQIAAAIGDALEIKVYDRAANVSSVNALTVTNPNLPPDPATNAPPLDSTEITPPKERNAFLYSGENPIQTGVNPDDIDAKRAAVIRGHVLRRDNQPLEGVTITIKDHPALGQTISRADGQFDMAVNGGGLLTVNYQKEGYLPVQRGLQVPWNDYANVEDVVMVPLDPQVTTIDLNDPVTPIQVARGAP